jgi:hypothetical protein
MAHATKKRHPEHGPTWRPKENDEQYDKIETPDGTKYKLYVPNFNQSTTNRNSSKKYKDVFDQIKAKAKDDPAIEKNEDGLPILDHVAWAALLSSTLKELNITWGVNDKIWIYNKIHDGTKSHAMYVAITPKITQRNAKRTVRKVSARKVSARKVSPMPPAPPALDSDNAVLHDGYISDKDIVFDKEPLGTITQEFYVRTRFNGNKYYYLKKKDADEGNSNYDHVEEYVSEDEKSIASADEDEGEKASKGGKSTRKHIRRKSTSKRTTTRRK